jgi:hypothetical protein
MKTLFYIVGAFVLCFCFPKLTFTAVGAAALLFVLAVLNVIDIKITLTPNRRE